MKRSNLIGVLALGATFGLGCGGGGGASDGGGPDDLVADVDGAMWPERDDGGMYSTVNLCGDFDPQCQEFGFGLPYNKPLPLPGDPQPDPGVAADGVGRDGNGWLVRAVEGGTSTYSYVFTGCGSQCPTGWYAVTWDADVPPNTSLTVHARSGPTQRPDAGWGQWTVDYKIAPVDLSRPGVLVPNWPEQYDNYLQVEFTFKSIDPKATPKLKSFAVAQKCPAIPDC